MLTLGFSPCPNDTFIFDAMIHGKVDTEGLEFEIIMEDVEALNRRAFAGDIDVTKLSYHAFAHLTDRYTLLDAGSALGNNCGPLLVARQPLSDEKINAGPIAIPGKMTTANFLLSLAYPSAQNKVETLFSDIEDAVLRGHAVAGLIIHENRFTYQQKGLVKLIDLGNTGKRLPDCRYPWVVSWCAVTCRSTRNKKSIASCGVVWNTPSITPRRSCPLYGHTPRRWRMW